MIYVPYVYNADSLYQFIDLAYSGKEYYDVFTAVGTYAYYLHVFDPAALDSLPSVSLEDADMMLLSAAWQGYAPAFTVIYYLNDCGLWHHSLPTNKPTIFPLAPRKDDPDYIPMTKKELDL